MTKKILLFVSMLVLQFTSTAQQNAQLRVSLLTCTPGDELYSIFGHSALRIVDSARGSDIVYNYGTFNFDEPDFYFRFLKGRLNYFLSVEYFEDFKYLYQTTNRGITEQVLSMDENKKRVLQAALNTNALEENRYYRYDFFFDNCTTRLRDIILKYQSPLTFKPVMDSSITFRKALHVYLDGGKAFWSKLGIDILLGSPSDRVMNKTEQQFLPDNLMAAIDNAQPAFAKTRTQLFNYKAPEKPAPFVTPIGLFIALLFLFIILSLFSTTKMVLSGLDGILFFCTGIVGCILVFMWIGSEHTMIKNNFNLIWALPTHIVAAFFINSKKTFVKNYFGITAISLIGILATWFFLPQNMNSALLPLVFLLLLRSASKYFGK